MIVKNFEQLASSPLRKQALLILEAGLEAVQPHEIMRDRVFVSHNGSVLQVRDQKFPLSPYKRIFVVGFGKGTRTIAGELNVLLGDLISDGCIIDVTAGDNIGRISSRVGTYPQLTVGNVLVTHEIMELLQTATADDLVINIVSSGGESLLCAPASITVEEERALIKALTEAGASSMEISVVQKHLSLVKGGQLGKLAYPATMINLFFSDVATVDVSNISGGPTVADSSTVHDASEIILKYGILHKLPVDSLQFNETPKEKKFFEFSYNIELCSPKDAILAMIAKAHDLGFRTKEVSGTLLVNAARHGNLPKVFQSFGNESCILATANSANSGYNIGGALGVQDAILASVEFLPDNTVILALDTNHAESSGVIVDASMRKQIGKHQIDSNSLAGHHNTIEFVEEIGARIKTDTAGNIGELIVFLRQ